MASAILDNMYNYYLTTYGKSTVSRYDSHKKSELRSVYNNIVKINKESPLYKIKDSADAQKFAIDIKEHARDLKNVIASLSTGDSLAEAFQKKIAVSDPVSYTHLDVYKRQVSSLICSTDSSSTNNFINIFRSRGFRHKSNCLLYTARCV